VEDDFIRRSPPRDAPEKETLEAYLDYHRATLLGKIDGLPIEDLRRVMVPSGISLLGIVKHLAYVELNWFQVVFDGQAPAPVPWTDEDPDADFRIEPGDSFGSIVAFYRREIEQSRIIVALAPSLGERAKREGRNETLRWIMVHMIEETARHNGHADIFRELIDGQIGE
jgi:Protein of unknown function (DUF664)